MSNLVNGNDMYYPKKLCWKNINIISFFFPCKATTGFFDLPGNTNSMQHRSVIAIKTNTEHIPSSYMNDEWQQPLGDSSVNRSSD